MKYWTLVGSIENWETGIANNVWGVRANLKKFWDKLELGDALILYVKSPISGIIGFGKIESKYVSDKPLWPDEIRENKVIYPYKFEFKIEYVLPKSSWKEKCVSVRGININIRAGVNSIKDKVASEMILNKLDSSWNTSFISVLKGEVKVVKPVNLHEDMKEKIYEIGKIERFISEKEYQMDNRRLDVVWRSSGVVGGAPKYIFEIQIGGNITEALSKLKHAYDLWAFPKLFLVLQDEELEKANQLIGGTFHEIRDQLKIITVEKINELYEVQIKDHKIKEELSLP